MRAWSPELRHYIRVEDEHSSIEVEGITHPEEFATRRDIQFEPSRIMHQQVDGRFTWLISKALPFLNGNNDGRFDTTARHDLRTFLQGSVKQFAETRFGFLNRPMFHETTNSSLIETGRFTGLKLNPR